MSESMVKKELGLFQFKLVLIVSLLSFGDVTTDEVERLDDLEWFMLMPKFNEVGAESIIKGASKLAKILELLLISAWVCCCCCCGAFSFMKGYVSCKWHLLMILSKQMLVSWMLSRLDPIFNMASVKIEPLKKGFNGIFNSFQRTKNKKEFLT